MVNKYYVCRNNPNKTNNSITSTPLFQLINGHEAGMPFYFISIRLHEPGRGAAYLLLLTKQIICIFSKRIAFQFVDILQRIAEELLLISAMSAYLRAVQVDSFCRKTFCQLLSVLLLRNKQVEEDDWDEIEDDNERNPWFGCPKDRVERKFNVMTFLQDAGQDESDYNYHMDDRAEDADSF